MNFSTILYEKADGVLTVTLNRPEKLNAYNHLMMTELIQAFDAADADDDVKAVIVTGAGRAFCAGADISGGSETFNFDKRADKTALGSPVREDGSIDYSHAAVRDNGGKVSLRVFDCLKPVIAAINGPAVGIGITMALPMDMRLASTNAKIGFPFTLRGIVPEAASSWFLPRIVGIGTALEWCMTGKILTADEALEAGLLRSIHAPEDLLPAARALAADIAKAAPVSVTLTRQMLWRGLTMAEPMDAHRIDSRGVYARGRMQDTKEGVTAFLEKRPATFSDRVSSDMPDFFPWWDERSYS
ncbi:Enoyl-CoA hydratase/isomerase [Sphingobium chlorophenolicum L-1]|uniref:Enoyl-CoA hydratase/isomerase n=1 Tax=Sphingobium chlorophenolicum L-1 TaxID=690566 RepID=F6F1J1_SPHCR|nr:crotonase/enoyl-CoA hydratase family protein [Sphingobium chlorophenolicum]AEG51407.1 Enoyl-CoA hydratase/isomerase [Sphingobium chlorophenolicum L-1]